MAILEKLKCTQKQHLFNICVGLIYIRRYVIYHLLYKEDWATQTILTGNIQQKMKVYQIEDIRASDFL